MLVDIDVEHWIGWSEKSCFDQDVRVEVGWCRTTCFKGDCNNILTDSSGHAKFYLPKLGFGDAAWRIRVGKEGYVNERGAEDWTDVQTISTEGKHTLRFRLRKKAPTPTTVYTELCWIESRGRTTCYVAQNDSPTGTICEAAPGDKIKATVQVKDEKSQPIAGLWVGLAIKPGKFFADWVEHPYLCVTPEGGGCTLEYTLSENDFEGADKIYIKFFSAGLWGKEFEIKRRITPTPIPKPYEVEVYVTDEAGRPVPNALV
ncbi:MAG: hypothetical protein ACXQTS_03715, partial [Candidatus Methanospirareceae archaeon]